MPKVRVKVFCINMYFVYSPNTFFPSMYPIERSLITYANNKNPVSTLKKIKTSTKNPTNDPNKEIIKNVDCILIFFAT